MSPILLLIALGGGGYLLFRDPKPAAPNANEASSEAQGLFANMLAPSMVDLATLQQAWAYFASAAKSLAAGSPAGSRLALYAIVCFLKACMLAKGAQPNANELAAIGRAPIEGGAGLISYGDAGMDQLQAVAAALAGTYSNGPGIGQYIQAISSAQGAMPRRMSFLLAMKAKQMLLSNPVKFEDAEGLPMYYPQCLFAIANIPAASVPASSPNSILNYQ